MSTSWRQSNTLNFIRRKRNGLLLVVIIQVATVFVYTYLQYLKVKKYSTDINLDKLESKSCKKMNLNEESKQPSIVASFGGGRTANQLCEFAKSYALWRQFGMLNFIEERQYNILEWTFDLPTLNESNENSPYYIWREGK